MVITEEVQKFSYYFIAYTPLRASDVVIISVAKQNMNVMESMFSAKHGSAGETKTKKIGKSK